MSFDIDFHDNSYLYGKFCGKSNKRAKCTQDKYAKVVAITNKNMSNIYKLQKSSPLSYGP